MKRIAIINHSNHSLYIEDISDEDLEKYNGEEEDYIKDNYGDMNFYSWDYIIDTQYYPNDTNKDPIDLNGPICTTTF